VYSHPHLYTSVRRHVRIVAKPFEQQEKTHSRHHKDMTKSGVATPHGKTGTNTIDPKVALDAAMAMAGGADGGGLEQAGMNPITGSRSTEVQVRVNVGCKRGREGG
jgi:hypothetical protein